MKNTKLESKNFYLYLLMPCLLYLIALSGCATVPVQQALPTYNLNGLTYISLSGLCESRSVDMDYNAFSKAYILSSGDHKVSLKVGDNLVLVDDKPQFLSQSVKLYQDLPVVPLQFKDQVFDVVFKVGAPKAAASICLLNVKKVVVDAGHGGYDPGAIGRTTGLREKAVNLDIAKRLKRLLEGQGVQVVMTRSSDTFISLQRRVDIANRSGADLFLSVHSNANRTRSLNGFEIYYISPKANDSKRAISAAVNTPLNLGSEYFGSRSTTLKAILWDMIYNNSRSESVLLARSICRTIKDSEAKVLGIKGANFYVLKGVTMPALLIEIGFLSNPEEERRLRSGYYRQKIAECIVDGVNGYSRNLATEVN